MLLLIAGAGGVLYAAAFKRSVRLGAYAPAAAAALAIAGLGLGTLRNSPHLTAGINCISLPIQLNCA